MNKKLFKSLFAIFIFLSFFVSSFAFDAKLSLDKNSSDINDYIKLIVKINSDSGGNIGITNIKGLENFDIISQSQSQSSSTSMIVNNGKTESKTNMSNNLTIVLKAKAKGDYKIGPATLKKAKEEIQTNVLNIKITGDQLFLNNNHLNIPKSKDTTKNSNNTSTTNTINNTKKQTITTTKNNINPLINKDKINTFNDIKQRDFTNNKSLYLLLGTLLLIGLVGYFIVKNRPEILSKLNIKKNEGKDVFKMYYEEDFKNEKIIGENCNLKKEIEEVDFDIELSSIVYPELKDDNFINEITEILKQKIANKYKINKINNKTFNEIIDVIGEKIDNDTKEFINIINKAKYSNLILDNSKILEIVKEYKI